jgi:hypothetical protein
VLNKVAAPHLFGVDECDMKSVARVIVIEGSGTAAAEIYLESVHRRLESRFLIGKLVHLRHEIRNLCDAVSVVQAQAAQLLTDSRRLDDLCHRNEMDVCGANMATIEEMVDGEICEDEGVIRPLNAFGCSCEKCRSGESLSALIRFPKFSATLGICAKCFQELSRLSLGHVT